MHFPIWIYDFIDAASALPTATPVKQRSSEINPAFSDDLLQFAHTKPGNLIIQRSGQNIYVV